MAGKLNVVHKSFIFLKQWSWPLHQGPKNKCASYFFQFLTSVQVSSKYVLKKLKLCSEKQILWSETTYHKFECDRLNSLQGITETTQSTIFRSIKGHNSRTVKVKIVKIVLWSLIMIRNNINNWMWSVKQFSSYLTETTQSTIYQSIKGHNSHTVKVKQKVWKP